MRTRFIAIISAAVLTGASAVAQVSPSPIQVQGVTPLGPQRQQPAGGAHQPFQGTLEGYVYWDTTAVQHTPPSNCNGLSVVVSVGTPPTGPTPTFEQFKQYRTINNLTYLNNGSTLGVCAYALTQVPTGQDLQVQISVAPSAFSSSVSPDTPPTANDPNGPIKIPGGQCANLAPAVPSASVLGSSWWTCGNNAYNVNFVLQSQGPKAMMGAGIGQGSLLGRPIGQPVAKSSPPAGMLTGSPAATTMLPQASPRGIQANASPTPAANPGQNALTNADVIKMVSSGMPESVIVSSIQSGTKNFDLGPGGCSSLQQAHVSANVLNVMSDGSVRPCQAGSVTGGGGTQAGDVSLQPAKGAAANSQVQFKLGPPKSGSVVKNPRAGQIDAAIVSALQKQKGAADIEAAQRKLGLRPATQTAGMPGGQSQLMSASGSGTAVQPLRGGASVSRVSQPGGSGASGKIPSSISQVANVDTMALVCTNDPTFRILRVSGSASPATFTPIDQYNLYTITGCSFGDNAPTNDTGPTDFVHLYGTNSFYAKFAIQFWSDNEIEVSIDPSLSGFLDADNLNLVIKRADGHETQKAGFKFYAARQTVQLKMIPSAWANLDVMSSGFTYGNSKLTPEFSSPASAPPGSEAAPVISGPVTGTAFVSRFYKGAKFDPTGQSPDWYDFTHLAPGWNTDSFQVITYPELCYGTVTYSQDFGKWDGYFGTNNPNIYIFVSDTTCSGFAPAAPWVNYQNWTGSYYALNVWVNGPRGTDPITGQPGS
jgi:hypothetical protein